MWFASQLCEKGIISSDQFAEAVSIQLSRQCPLGAIATRKSLLTVKQSFQVLAENATNPEQCFGQTAIELGFLTEAEVAMLLFEQARLTPSINDILVEQGFLSRAELAKELYQLRGDKQYLSSQLPAKV